MDFDRATVRITASKQDWEFLRAAAALKAKIALPALGLWRQNDDEFLWRKISTLV